MADEKIKPLPAILARRLGRYRIPRHILLSLEPDPARKLFSKFIIIDCKYLIHLAAFEYIAYSDLFEPVECGQECPMYLIKITKESRQVIISADQVKP